MERKKALVTGASRGIGKGVALCLARQGYDVAISYATQADEARRTAAELEAAGARCWIFEAKLNEPGAGQALFDEAVAAMGGLDLLVNNAGVTKFESIFEMTEETLEFLIALDFKNYLLMTRAAARHMAAHGVRGCIINVTSSRGERAYPGDAVYGGLKAGLNRAIQSIALDLAPYGIRINNVAPGAIRIRTAEEIARDEALRDLMPTDFWDKLGQRIPLERTGLPDDIGGAVAFLASEAASYITGVTLRVDGGLILPGMPEQPDPTLGGWGAQKSFRKQEE